MGIWVGSAYRDLLGILEGIGVSGQQLTGIAYLNIR